MNIKTMRAPRHASRPIVEELVSPRPLPPPPPPTPEEIRLRAYEIYLARRPNPGTPMDDWLQAERELLSAHAEAKAAGGCRCSGGKCSGGARKHPSPDSE